MSILPFINNENANSSLSNWQISALSLSLNYETSNQSKEPQIYSYNKPNIKIIINEIKIHNPTSLPIKKGTGNINEISTSKMINKIEIKKNR